MTKQTEKPPAPDPVTIARADVDRLNAAEKQCATLHGVKAAELSAARAKRGDDVLAANDPGAAARASSQAIAVMVEELAALADAAAAARRQRLAAIPAVFKAEADELERHAAQLDVEAAANEAAVREALKAVEVIADCPYAPRAPMMPDHAIGPGQQGGALAVVSVPTPLFQRLRLRAQGLRLEAPQRRVKEPHRAGSIDAESLDRLVDVVFSDSMRVGPSVDALSSWFDQAVERERTRRQRIDQGDDFVPVAEPITKLHVEWRNAVIDISSSFVSSSTQSRPAMQVIDTEADFAVAAATGQSA